MTFPAERRKGATSSTTGTAERPSPLPQHYTTVAATIRAQGLLERARGFYLAVGIVLAVALAGAVTGSILLGESWFQLLIAAALGVIFTQIAFVAHEASHRQILSSGPANDRLGRLLATAGVGMSYAWWMNKHNRHHANPNKIGKDPDIEVDTISFIPEDAAKRRGLLARLTQRQGYFFFPLLTLEGFNLHYRSFAALASRGEVKGRWIEIGSIVARFALYLGVLFAFLPLGMAFAFLGVQMAVFGVYMGASFAPNHKGMPVVPRDVKLDFFSKQVRTSRNIEGGWWASTLMGGLNHQVEHHLFPNMPRPHLARARRIVREYCQTHQVPYTETSLFRSYGIVISYLNTVGLAARDPFECPVIAQLRRS
ncbi:delta fatty acid desaturase [Tersicoccus sp. Bi-70]|nr:acyl-CoA desaturase [Tersicoccus sp. Bi-70]OMH36968.1 delta fatty acid desaturase [Tersicoccus sp. Bi-70]